MITIIHALHKNWPNCEWGCDNNNYEGLHWSSNNSRPKPTAEELNSVIAELEADYASKEYQRQRAAAYPSWQDQLDKIFHSGVNAWKTDIQAIKDKYPKP